ncbi:MAG TPA: hypothetical protein VHE59_20120 [Mucilaginibacter sp.]|nr:hypothetical protein [Mucilaginibacter sp.]
MKKILIVINLIIILMIAVAFKNMSNKKSIYNTSTVYNMALNGVDEKTALLMIKHFNAIKANDKHPKSASIWFNKDILHGIVTLLKAERAYAISHPRRGATDKRIGVTDGFRIYFACDSSANSYPLSTSILIVATKDSGKSPIVCRSGRLHHDYYNHSISTGLFQLGNINGSICYGKGQCTGNKLYKLCIPCSDDPTCPSLPHGITTLTARKMVKRFIYHPHAINTESEWFDIGVLEAIDTNKLYDGFRIYFSTHLKDKKDTSDSLKDSFVIVPTKFNQAKGIDEDKFNCETAAWYLKFYRHEYPFAVTGPGQDNGELCPNSCN